MAGLSRTRQGRAGQGRAEGTWLGIFDVLLIVKDIIESRLTLRHAALRSNIINFLFLEVQTIFIKFMFN